MAIAIDTRQSDFLEMDNAKISREHWKIMLISGMGFFTDAYDLFIIGVVMALLRPLWQIGKVEEAPVESTALFGFCNRSTTLRPDRGYVGPQANPRDGGACSRRRSDSLRIVAEHLVADRLSVHSWHWNRRRLSGLRYHHERVRGKGSSRDASEPGICHAGSRPDCRTPSAALLLSTHLSNDIIWRILVSFGAIPALAVYDARRHLKETPRFLKAAGQEEDETGNLNSLSILISTLTLSRSGMASIVWSMTREFLSASSVQVQLGF
jgi:MFS transporter, PHS family, inorganic phosphate transporter